ncbi:MFS transporter [Streptomyces sp. NPDC020983]|uniref:MFS transporter n=1 Tax=Streptomyces sp. NPDC020983 TaxID=3365106 RepID=UPI0037A16CBB
MTTRPQHRLALAQLANSVGDGAFYTTSALYFTRALGLSAGRTGLGLTVAWAAGSLAGVPLGRLADRRGPRGTSVLLALATSAAVGGFLLVRGFAAFVAVACVYTAAQSGLAASRQALLARLVPAAERTRLLARLQAILNSGLAAGAAAGGLALAAGTAAAYRAALGLDALCFLGCALLLLRLPAAARAGDASPAAGASGHQGVLCDRPYVLVALLNTVLMLRLPLLSLALPLWITERTGAPAWLASGLFVLNTAAVALFQVRSARAVTGLGSAVRAVRVSGLVMFACCAVFALSAGRSAGPATAVLLAGAVLQVVAEMQQSAGSWQLSFDLAPAGRIGEYQGFFGTGVTVARTLGPLVLTTLLLDWGPPGWLLLGALTAAAAHATGPAARWAARGGAARDGGGAVPDAGPLEPAVR